MPEMLSNVLSMNCHVSRCKVLKLCAVSMSPETENGSWEKQEHRASPTNVHMNRLEWSDNTYCIL